MLELRVKRNEYQCTSCSTEFVFYREENSNQVHCVLELDGAYGVEKCYLGSIEEEGIRLPHDRKLAFYRENVDIFTSKYNEDGSKDKILRDMSNKFLKPVVVYMNTMPIMNGGCDFYSNMMDFCIKVSRCYTGSGTEWGEEVEKTLTAKDLLKARELKENN